MMKRLGLSGLVRAAIGLTLVGLVAACGGGGGASSPPPQAPLAPSITVQPSPASVTAPAAASFTVTATGTAPLAYQWRRDGVAIAGATSSSYTLSPTAVSDSGAQFSVEVSNSAGRAASNAATLTVSAAPVPAIITTPPANAVVTAGQTATFSVTASGTATITYQWRRDGVDISGATAASYTTPATVLADNGAVFSVRVSNAVGSAESSGALLTVLAAPVAPSITAEPADATATAGQSAGFTVAASGTAPLTYQWRRNGTAIAGATTASYATGSTATADDGALFSVVVSNSVGSVTSRSARLTVSPAPVAPTITAQPQATAVTAGQTATFSVAATGTAPLAHQWQRNGLPITGATSASHTTPATTLADDGALFSVVVSNVAGSATSAAAQLSVAAAPVAPSITTQPAAATVQSGQTATFTVAASGTAPLAYQWRRDGTAIVGATAVSYTTLPTVDADNGARFSVVVSNVAGSATSAEATLSVTPAPVVPTITAQPLSVSVVEGQSASFSVTATGTAPLAYQWRRNGTAIAGATASTYVTPATTLADNGAQFSVVVSNAAGPVTSGAATLTVTPIQWSGIREEGTGGDERANAVATDANGNVIVGGFIQGIWPGTPADQRGGSLLAKYAPNGVPLWIQQMLGDEIKGVGVDAAGNIYAAGYQFFRPFPEVTSRGGNEGWVAKFDPNGNRLWVRGVGSDWDDFIEGMAVDAAGNVVVVGGTTGQINASGVRNNGSGFVARLNTNGDFQWAVQVDSSGVWDRFFGVAMDAAGNAYVTGRFDGVLNGVGSAGFEDVLVMKIDPLGNELWSSRFGTQTRDEGLAITVNPAGTHVYVTGYTYGQWGLISQPTITKPFLIRLDGSDGSSPWRVTLTPSPALSGSASDRAQGYGIATNADGSAIYFTGYTRSALEGTTAGGVDLYVARYDSSGDPVWIRQFTAPVLFPAFPPSEIGNAITLDRSGEVFVVGTITGGTLGAPATDAINEDWFVMKLRAVNGVPY